MVLGDVLLCLPNLRCAGRCSRKGESESLPKTVRRTVRDPLTSTGGLPNPSRKRNGHRFSGSLPRRDVFEGVATRIVGYCRVSSREQADEGVSLGAQRAKLQAYAVAMDLELVALEEDAGVSAKSLDGRHGLSRALAALDAGRADGILVAKLDRLTRSVRDLGHLVDRYFASKWSLLSVADSIDTRTASGRLVLNVLTSVAQWEREATGERTRDALAHLKSEGVLLGAIPLGVRRTGEVDASGRRIMVSIEDELHTIERMRELRCAGMSLRQIARKLVAESRSTKRGGRWEAATVGAILKRVRKNPPAATPHVLTDPSSRQG